MQGWQSDDPEKGDDVPLLGRPETWVLILILAGVAIRVAFACVMVPLGDETYYHWLGSQFHLSYFDHPPLCYWMAGVGGRLVGSIGFLAVRLPFILMFAGSTWLMFLIGREVSGSLAGFCAALLINLTCYFSVGAGALATPDGPLVFSWLACAWCLVRIFFRPDLESPIVWWLAAGACLGLVCLSKYHAVFIPFGAGLFILVNPKQRHWALSVGPYLALVVCIIISLPVLLWNYQHDWISFSYQLSRGIRFKGLDPGAGLLSLLGQSLLLFPWLWVPLTWEFICGFARGRTDEKRLFISLMAVGPIVLFTITATYNGQWYLFHWQTIGYLLLFAALGWRLADWIERGATWAWCLLVAAAVLGILVGLAVFGQILTGWWGPTLGPHMISRQSQGMMTHYEFTGFKGLSEHLERQGLTPRDNLFILTSNNMDSSRMDWILRGRYHVLCYSKSDECKHYPFIEGAIGWRGADAVLVSRRETVGSDVLLVTPHFRRVISLGSFNAKRGPYETILHLHLCEDMVRTFTFPYGG